MENPLEESSQPNIIKQHRRLDTNREILSRNREKSGVSSALVKLHNNNEMKRKRRGFADVVGPTEREYQKGIKKSRHMQHENNELKGEIMENENIEKDEMSMAAVESMVNALENKDTAGFKDLVSTELSFRINSAMDAKKEEIAKSLTQEKDEV